MRQCDNVEVCVFNPCYPRANQTNKPMQALGHQKPRKQKYSFVSSVISFVLFVVNLLYLLEIYYHIVKLPNYRITKLPNYRIVTLTH